MKLLADATLPALATSFRNPFQLKTYNNLDELHEYLGDSDILLCRSTLKVNQETLGSNKLKIIATASSGTDHIDKGYLKENNIQLIDAKGSNANSVADYMEATFAYLNTQGMIKGTRAGIIGMGYVGNAVAKRLHKLGFDVIGYDPIKALNSDFNSVPIEDLFACDMLCIHPNLHDNGPFPSRHLISTSIIEQLKTHCIVINASRGAVVDEHALLSHFKQLIYCTDVYENEPNINKHIIDYALLCTPHIAGHSIEAKYGAVTMVSNKLYHALNKSPPKYNNQPGLINPKHNNYHNVLDIYNPIEETQKLKASNNLKKTFTTLRKQHNKRHDFSLCLSH